MTDRPEPPLIVWIADETALIGSYFRSGKNAGFRKEVARLLAEGPELVVRDLKDE